MSVSFMVAVVGVLAAGVLTGLLVRICARAPRLDLAALAAAAAALTVCLIAQAIGYDKGFSPISFRGIQLGAQLFAPTAIAWALAEMTGKSFGVRFAARLALSGMTVVAGVILATDPLSGRAFGTSWPPAPDYYQVIPNGVLEVAAAATALAAIVAVVVTSVRARREAPWRELLLAVAAAATATLATDGLRARLPANAAYAGICLLAVALVWFAGSRASGLSMTVLRGSVGSAWDDPGHSYPGYGEPGSYQGFPDSGEFGRAPADTGSNGWFGGDTGDYQPVPGNTDFSDWYREPGSRPEDEDSDTGYRSYPGVGTDSGPVTFGDIPTGLAAIVETGDVLPAIDAYPPGTEEALAGHDTSRLYGQIAIYTLLDGREDDFDRLAEQIVIKVKSREPGTLVYVMHGVPSAPMQRILYEVYRDEAAFAEHTRQSYVREFEEARKAYVLATNVIQLGVRHAMFSPVTDVPRPSGQEGGPWRNGSR